MTFTRGWNNATPAGTRAANEIDDAIREFKVDIYERWLAKIFTAVPNDTDEDLTIVKPEILGNKTKRLMVHGDAFQADSGAAADYATDGLTTNDSAAPVRAPIYLPPGVTITEIRWLLSAGLGTPTLTISLKKMLFAVAKTISTEDTKSMAITTTAAIYGNGALAEVDQILIDDNNCYFLECDLAGSTGLLFFTIHGVEITYDCPDCSLTL